MRRYLQTSAKNGAKKSGVRSFRVRPGAFMQPDGFESSAVNVGRPTEPNRPGLSADLAFGALAGLLMGAAVGWTCLWLIGQNDSGLYGALAGSVIGSLGGALLGVRHSRRRQDQFDSDLGTTISVIYPLLPGLLILLNGVGIVRGRFTGLMVLGAAFACPMLGMLVGGLLDRCYESILRRRQRRRAKPADKG